MYSYGASFMFGGIDLTFQCISSMLKYDKKTYIYNKLSIPLYHSGLFSRSEVELTASDRHSYCGNEGLIGQPYGHHDCDCLSTEATPHSVQDNLTIVIFPEGLKFLFLASTRGSSSPALAILRDI